MDGAHIGVAARFFQFQELLDLATARASGATAGCCESGEEGPADTADIARVEMVAETPSQQVRLKSAQTGRYLCPMADN